MRPSAIGFMQCPWKPVACESNIGEPVPPKSCMAIVIPSVDEISAASVQAMFAVI
jgi:hypothetical protein